MNKFYTFIVFLFISTVLYSQKITRTQYIQTYKDVAVKQMRLYNIPASIILAQACLESGNGNSTLATKANNHFGIKCHKSWKGKTYKHDDDKKRECFRKYNSPIESFEDHSIFLSTGSRYSSLFDLKITDYKAWAHGLKAAGYATNPKYAQLLIDIIQTYKLYEYDVPRTFDTSRKDKKAKKRYEKMQKKALKQQAKQNKGAVATVAGGAAAATATTVSSSVPNNAAQPLTRKECRLYKYSKEREIYLEDGKYYVYTKEGDTYSSLAKEYKLFTKTLLKSNNITAVDRIPAGTKVFLCNEIK